MNKLIKLICSLFIVTCISVFLLNINKVEANTTYINSANTAEWNISSEISKNISGMTYTQIKGQSKSSQGSGCQTFGDQTVSLLEMKTDGISSKLVCWGVQNGSIGVVKSTLTKIASDYEANHPGWLVVGGVNGDQYFMNYGTGIWNDGSWLYTPTACYPLMIDNELRYPISPVGSDNNFRGILNNGEAESFADEAALAGVRVEIIDENNNIISWYDVDNINKTPAAGEVTVWSSYISTVSSGDYVEFDVTTNSNLYIVENPELAYMPSSSAYNDPDMLGTMYPDNNFPDVIFGRGAISKIDKTYHFGGSRNSMEERNKVNAFAIETDDPTLQAALTMNTRIRVEYYYTSEELNNCEYFLNYHSVQRENGEDVYSDQSYDLTRYSRSVWGRKADGTYILLTTAMYESKGQVEGKGTSQAETNAILEKYGVVEAFQQDGGGSAMCIVKNFEKGTYDIVQHSRDGGTGTQRSVAYGCFFVVRDPSIEITPSKTTYHSVTFDKKEDTTVDAFNIKITLNGKTYDFTDTCVIDGLDPETTYDYTIEYDYKDGGETQHGTFSSTVTTHKMEFPLNVVRVNDLSTEEVEFVINDALAQNIQVHINGSTYTYTTNDDKLLVVDGLQREETYLYTYTFDVVNEYNGKTYSYTSNDESITTPDYEKPKIKKFELEKTEIDYVRVAYTYTDPDKVVTSAYILCGNDIYDLTIKSDSVKVTDLDLAHKEYQIQLFIEYKDKTITSDIITVGTNSSVVEDEPTSSSCNSGAVYIYLASMLGIIFLFKRKH